MKEYTVEKTIGLVAGAHCFWDVIKYENGTRTILENGFYSKFEADMIAENYRTGKKQD